MDSTFEVESISLQQTQLTGAGDGFGAPLHL